MGIIEKAEPRIKSKVICVAGWHFQKSFYQDLALQKSADVFIVSHKKPSQIPDNVLEWIPEDHILYKSNIGYDWGCYQQFLSTGIWKNYQTIVFMHDDLEVHDLGFLEELDQLLSKHAVIGNGRGKESVGNVTVGDHAYAYAHSKWKPPSWQFQHQTVRGSFFAISQKTLEKIGSFEVYWDPFKLFIGFGNWSTKASCGKIQAVMGENAFGYLSNTYRKSRYIKELVRGNSEGTPSLPVGWRRKLYLFLKRISIISLAIKYQRKTLPLRAFWDVTLSMFLGLFSKKIY